jgi:hypothetical protein
MLNNLRQILLSKERKIKNLGQILREREREREREE